MGNLMTNKGERSLLTNFKHIVTKEDVPILNNDLEFEIHFGDSFMRPIRITFLCDKITQEEVRKMSENDVHTSTPSPATVPCCFSVSIPESDVDIKPGSMIITHGNIINKTVNDFFQAIVLCKDSKEADERFNTHNIHIEKIKSLTTVYERNVLTEKSKKRKSR